MKDFIVEKFEEAKRMRKINFYLFKRQLHEIYGIELDKVSLLKRLRQK